MLNDDQLLDARDMAEEIAQARGETCDVHEGMLLPCPLSHDKCELCGAEGEHLKGPCPVTAAENGVLDDIDAVVEQVARPRTFEDVINQWTEAVLKQNREAKSIESIAVVFLLGSLGQRLIYEANDIGMRQVMETTREVLKQ